MLTPDEIRALRFALDETQEQFGTRFTRTARTVKKWEAGETKPSGAVMVKMEKLKDDWA